MKMNTNNESEIKLSSEQQAIVDAIESGINVLVTGPAGTGKSIVLKALRAKYGAAGLAICASTGIAAVNVGGVTIHSWAGLGLADETAKKIGFKILGNRSAGRDKAYNAIMETKRLAIDEVSMISASLLDKISDVFKMIRKNELPFGGIQMVFFGDMLQLKPIIKGNEPDGFAFESKAWQEAKIKTFLLTKIFRQEEAEFSQVLNEIRKGIVSPLGRKLLSSRYQQVDPDPTFEPVVVHTHNADVDSINEERLMQLPGDYQSFSAKDEGQEAPLKLIQKNCPAPTILSLKLGAQVMLCANLEVESGLANGSLGKVSHFVMGEDRSGKQIPMYVRVKFINGEERDLEPWEWTIEEHGKVVASRQQIPLRLAWAITSHKSQGQTLDKIKVYLGKVFEDGQAYVALSRVRTLKGLFIESTKQGAIRANAKALAFYEEASK